MKFGILGGDYRYKFLYEMLINEGKEIKAYNNKYIENLEEDLDSLLSNIDVLISSIPFSKDNKTIFMPDFEQIVINNLIDKMSLNNVKILIGGVINNDVIEYAEKKGIQVYDFFSEESVAISNAIPTAEGAIQTAMEESDKTIFGSKCIVFGYGRCGKILANILKGMGANVIVTHRNKKDLAYIKAYGLEEVNLYNTNEIIGDFDFIFNTIPHCVIDESILKNVKKDTIIIDLAQAPGGVDYNFARDLGIKALYCPGLPGRVAPFTAGKILKDCILEFCERIENI